MTALIVWACIAAYLTIGAICYRGIAIASYWADRNKWGARVADSPASHAGYAVAKSLIWPVFGIALIGENAIRNSIEENEMLAQVRKQIESERKLARTKHQQELEAFDRAMKEPK